MPPKAGRPTWLDDAVYRIFRSFTVPAVERGTKAMLRELPLEACDEVGPDIHPQICRPGGVTLGAAGEMRGDWTPRWYFDPQGQAVQRISAPEPATLPATSSALAWMEPSSVSPTMRKSGQRSGFCREWPGTAVIQGVGPKQHLGPETRPTNS
jgi:hypothetical protein